LPFRILDAASIQLISMKIKILFLFLSAAILFQACKTPQELYDAGNYEKAYKVASKKLEKYKDTETNTQVLKNSLEKIITSQASIKEQLLKTDDFANRDKVIQINNELIDRIHWVRIFVPGAFEEEFQQMTEENAAVKGSIKEDRLKIGKEILAEAQKEGDKFKARSAWEQFKTAKTYQRGKDADLDSLISISEEMATLIYYVQADQRLAFGSRMDLDKIFVNINNEGDRFTKYHYKSAEHLENADCLIGIDVGSIRFEESSSKASKDFSETIVVGTETTTNDKGQSVEVDVTEVVTGTVTQTTTVINTKCDVKIEIQAQNKNCRLNASTFTHEFNDEVARYSTSGDLRAIPDEYENTRPGQHRSKDELSKIMVERIYAEVLQRLSGAQQSGQGN